MTILKAHLLAAALLSLALNPVQAQTSQNLSLRWFTIDCGGGLSSAGEYSLQGSIGQPDVEFSKRALAEAAATGELTATSELENVYLLGGYMPGVVAVLATPRLNIRRDGMTTVVLSWQVSPMDFYVQGSTNLNMSGEQWEFLFTDEIDRADDNWEMNLRTIGPARYFRLIPAWLTRKL